MRIPPLLRKVRSPLDIAPLIAAALAVVAAPFARAGASDAAPYTLAGSNRHFTRLQDAVDAIGDGAGTIRIAPGRWHDCAVQARGIVTFAAEVPGQSELQGRLCEGKAGLVLRGRGSRIEGLVFSGYRVPDGNGAGIRLERGDLAVVQAWFRDSEQGILSGDDAGGSVAIDKSTFSHLGRCDRGLACAHSIYIGHYGSVTVTRSRFEAGDGGHYLKARAARVRITDCAFDDSKGRDTNYMIDLPAGATGRIAGNWFRQGPNKENPSALIAVAAESHDNRADDLAIEGNAAEFAPDAWRHTALVADWSGDRLAVGENRLDAGFVKLQRRYKLGR